MATLDKISTPEYQPEPPKITIAGLYHDTDRGNAERFRDLNKDKVRYCYPLKSWMVWNGKVWEQDDDVGQVYNYARKTIDSIFDEACDLDGERRQELMKFGFKTEATHSINNMLEQAQSQTDMPILPSDFNKHSMKFNVQNGTINLVTGILEPHNINDFITKISPVMYDPEAKCPIFLAFLETTFKGDKDLIEYHQRNCGYALTGSTREESFDIFYGSGQNGKSKYTGIIIFIMGDYHIKINIETLQETANSKGGNEASSDVAVLQGARLVTVSEPSKGMVLNEQRIKDWTGRDPVTARPLYKKPITFTPEFKVFMYTNHKPIIKSQGMAIWRRLKLTPFENTISEDEKDPDLDLKLQSEASGILNWMIEGCLKWQKDGLKVPESIITATHEYKDELDTLSDFISDCCEIDKKTESYALPLFTVYQAWVNLNEIERPFKQKGFPVALDERGFKKLPKDMFGVRIKGLRLIQKLNDEYNRLKTQTGVSKYDTMTNMTEFLETFLHTHTRTHLSDSASYSSLHHKKGLSVSKLIDSQDMTIRRIVDIIKQQHGSTLPNASDWVQYKKDIISDLKCSDETGTLILNEVMRSMKMI